MNNKPLSVLTATGCGTPVKPDLCVQRARYTIPCIKEIGFYA